MEHSVRKCQKIRHVPTTRIPSAIIARRSQMPMTGVGRKEDFRELPLSTATQSGRSISSPGAASLPCAILEKAFRCLRQEPRQRHFDAERVLQHFNARRRSQAERAHAEAQCISFPSLLLHRDHRSEVTVGAVEALFETAERLDLPETMADDDCDGIAHGNRNRVA